MSTFVKPPISKTIPNFASSIGKYLAIVALTMISAPSIADYDYRRNIYFASGFLDTVDVDMTQAYDTRLNYSCGPTSLLYVANYHYSRLGIKPWFTRDLMSTRYLLRQIYINMNIPYNSSNGVSTGDLKSLAKNKWGWRTAAVANGNNSYSKNFSSMLDRLKNNQPVIVALWSAHSPVRGFNHLVVVYKYDAKYDRVYYFDPYYGGIHTKSKRAFGQAVQGELPYFVADPFKS